MRFFKSLLLRPKQAGFTLVEVMAALAITGLIGLGASVSSLQLLNQTSRDTDYTAASRYAMNAIHWISRDAQMAQTIDGYEGFPAADDLSFTWTAWDNTEHSAEYTVENGTLKRTYSDGSGVYTTMIAQYINTAADSTNCTWVDNVLILTVTSSVGEGARTIDVTKIREITNRADL